MNPFVGYEVFPWRACAWDDTVTSVLEQWRGTPYCAGGSVRGEKGGVDCVRFVACVLNDLDGKERKPLTKLPRDTAFHDGKKSRKALRDFLRLYSPYTKEDGSYIESGDIIVVQPEGAEGPGHALVASSNSKMLFHAATSQVEEIHIFRVGQIHAIYRPAYKEDWIQCSV